MDAVTKPFWDATLEGRLTFQQCPVCGHRQFYPRAACTACGATPELRDAAGTGTVHTFTVIRQFGGPGFKDELPYVVAMIDLDEGVRMMGNVTDVDPETVAHRRPGPGLVRRRRRPGPHPPLEAGRLRPA